MSVGLTTLSHCTPLYLNDFSYSPHSLPHITAISVTQVVYFQVHKVQILSLQASASTPAHRRLIEFSLWCAACFHSQDNQVTPRNQGKSNCCNLGLCYETNLPKLCTSLLETWSHVYMAKKTGSTSQISQKLVIQVQEIRLQQKSERCSTLFCKNHRTFFTGTPFG